MVRGMNSASVVPTASDEHAQEIPSQHSNAPTSSEAGGAENSPEEESTNTPSASTVEVQAEMYLQAAFNGQIGSKQDDIVKDPSTFSEDSGDFASHLQHSNPKGIQQKTVAPLVGKTLRGRSQSVVLQNDTHLTKNYLELVGDFRQLRPFTRLPDGKYPDDTLCVYCSNTKLTSVFFPCQHLCVCNSCIQLNEISTDYSSSAGWSACPVCMTEIRLILPHSGKEEEKYWKWVMEIKPSLPSNFKQEFKEAGKQLNKTATLGRTRRNSMFRRDSTPAEEAPKDPPQKPKVLNRSHTWQPGEAATVRNVAASNEQDVAHNCSIL